MLLERGALLNQRYRILEILGQGGMGSVYKAVDENLGVEVAVKDNLFTTDEYARQFRREAVILATLRHANLPRVTDHFVIDGQGQYLVMDYIEGEDLRQRMDRVGMLADEEVIIIGAAICDALTYLASRKPQIVHRDIKPGNVRITPQGHIYLVDFGLAKDLKTHQTTTTGARAMTPGYSPPEQYGTARTDQRSDIYSLGATLYAALTGMIPEDALSRAVDHLELTTIRKYNGRVSRRLAAAIEKALDIRPDGRFQNSEEFKQALLSASTPSRRNVDEYVVAPPPVLEDRPLPGDHALVPPEVALKLPRTAQPPPEIRDGGAARAQPSNWRRKGNARPSLLAFWLAMLLLLILAGAVGGFYYLNPRLTEQTLDSVLEAAGNLPPFFGENKILATPTADATGQVVSLALPAHTPTATSSPQPSQTPTQKPEPSPTATPTETSLPTGTPTPTVTQTPLPTLMGGGNGQIAFASDRNAGLRLPQIWLINADGTEPRQLTAIQEGACQPVWSPDGRQLIFISPCDRNKEAYPGSALFLIPDVDAETIEVIPLPTAPGGDYDPAWSPDGMLIAFTSERETGSPRLYLMDLTDKSVKVITQLFYRTSQPAWSPSGGEIAHVDEKGFGRIVIRDMDGATVDLLERKPSQAEDLHPTWSPDGQVILFTRYPAQGKPPQLIAVAEENDQTQIQFPVYSGPIPMREAKYSPDGLWLVFESWPSGGNHEVEIMTTNGSSRRNLSNHPRYDFDPAWRPAIR